MTVRLRGQRWPPWGTAQVAQEAGLKVPVLLTAQPGQEADSNTPASTEGSQQGDETIPAQTGAG